MKIFTKRKIIEIQETIIKMSDLPEDAGMGGKILDGGTLEHIVNRANSIEIPLQCAAWLLYSIALFHPFFQGNKRTAFMAAEFVLVESPLPCSIVASSEEIDKFVIQVARDQKTLDDVEQWICANAKK
jgi:death-on-curing family protein